MSNAFIFGPAKHYLGHLFQNRLSKKGLHTTAIVLLLLSFGSLSTQAEHLRLQEADRPGTEVKPPVRFYLKNNSFLPRKVTFIIYQPQEVGNNTRIKWLLPFQRVRFNLPVDSKIYIATNTQVDRVMQGKRIDEEKPFLKVSQDISRTTLRLSKRQ